MIIRSILALALLLFSGGFALFAWRSINPHQIAPAAMAAETPGTPVVRIGVVVTTRPMPPGTLLKEEDVQIRQVAQAEMPPGAFIETDTTKAELSGALLRRYVEAGEVVRRDDVLRPRDRGFLAAVLRPGMRAISIGVNAVTGAAGLIWPGDQVDLILTQELDVTGNPQAPRQFVGETVLTNVRVIAVDQLITQGATGTSASATGPGPRNVARTVTLEVSASQAERVAVAERLGRLTLAVRPVDLEGAPLAAATGSVFGTDVSPALSNSGPRAGVRMRVLQGGTMNEVTFQ
ncbi:Flp pilus assembly protein CpaB [Falsiroseomonas sp.]|uniref:Flp pilus assembly protein CpaB n=1 Tax=Falsiroseomonas sp. TaxID=2870721 RepID=UPI0035633BD7